jgi:hypothetical protein
MIKIELNEEELQGLFDRLDQVSPEEKNGAIFFGLRKGAADVLNSLQEAVTANILKVRSGNLRRSLGFRVDYDADGLPSATIGSGALYPSPMLSSGTDEETGAEVDVSDTDRVVYATILEEGGTIKPKGHKYLAIPTENMKTAAGVARARAGYVWKNPGEFGFSTTIILGKMIYGVSGAKGTRKLTPIFSLVESVEIPAFEYMSRTAEENREVVIEDMVNAIEETWRKN